jgi:hypothetical protein
MAEEIDNTLLKNPYKQGNDLFKLLPTQSDRDTFLKIVRGEPVGNDSQISRCYHFFESELKKPGIENLEKLKQIIVGKLVLVSIVLDSDDNPHLVFESLNAKGRALSQADLIRNYFFMKIHVDEQEQQYVAHWKPMQDKLDESLTEFIRHFLMKDGGMVKQSEVYFALKERADGKSQKEIIDYLAEIANYADLYAKLLHPELETSAILRQQLTMLNRIEVTTAYPFLLSIYREYTTGALSEAEFSEVLRVLENFLVRRFVCGVPTYGLNKMFPTLYAQAKQNSDFIVGLKESLRTKQYPRDTEFRERLITSKLYGPGERIEKTKIVLERLEESFDHQEQVTFDDLQIEHVMPQTLTDSWKAALGEDWEATHELLLHTLGNLTLTGYNAPLSNDDFSNKKKILAQSHLELNKYFGSVDKWDDQAIRQRAEILAERSLQIWEYFWKGHMEAPSLLQGVTGTTPNAVTIKGKRFEASSWREVQQLTLEFIAEADDERFQNIVAQFPRFVGKDAARFRAPKKLSNGLFMEANLSANAIQRFCIQVTEAAGLSSDDWRVDYNSRSMEPIRRAAAVASADLPNAR